MRRILTAVTGAVMGAACALALGGCQKPEPGPEMVVQGIYTMVTPKLRRGEPTTSADLPLTTEFAAQIEHANNVAHERDEPFIDGDLAANCQDCTQLTDFQAVITSPPANGRAVVEARFKLDGNPSTVIWDMKQTPQGWRVDNIRAPDGYDLAKSAQQEIAYENMSCSQDRGAEEAAQLVGECAQVSPATHPPCNAENTCHVIENEIRRGCGMLTGKKPDFCAANASGEAP